jgi:hypothetical protein
MRSTVLAILAALVMPATADAFCGFYVAGSDQQLVNDATQVVMMRSGTRTVLAMQNAYTGPAEEFAMVVPVPVVLHEGDVKTLDRAVFAHVEAMGAPRLVEYWEQDPCRAPELDEMRNQQRGGATRGIGIGYGRGGQDGVTVEAQFVVGEYQIVILSAKDSTGLETWLHEHHYQIPAGAESLLRPYVEAGSKFFVAKVDPTKVKLEDGHAALSPLRFHYDADEFTLPIRLGLANSAGTQDLIVNIFAPHQRYQVSNYDNVTIPTNLDVRDDVRGRFGAFYAALFDATLEKHPHAIVTEYAWQATRCDPCPGPTLKRAELATLGADVLGGPRGRAAPYVENDFVMTRLHARYGKEVANDLVFTQAPPIVGGRERVDGSGQLEHGAQPDAENNFQARYVIRHPWNGPIRCEHPVRGRWGGPPPGAQIATSQPEAATNLAYAPRGGVRLDSVLVAAVPELAVSPSGSAAPPETRAPPPAPARTGCGCNSCDPGGLAVVLALLVRPKRRRVRSTPA